MSYRHFSVIVPLWHIGSPKRDTESCTYQQNGHEYFQYFEL